MGRRIVAMYLALSTWACGGKAQTGELAPISDVDLGGQVQKAGTRLKPLTWVSDSGPPSYTRHFRDIERQEDCTFSLADDGTYRCFPIDVATASLSAYSQRIGFYADPKCKQPLFTTGWVTGTETDVFPPRTAPRYAALDMEEGCGSGRRIYELGARYSGPVYSPTASIGCGGLVNPPTVYEGGPRISNAEFERAVIVVSDMRDGSLAMNQLTAEDGSAQIVGFYDLEAAAACGGFYSDPGMLCVPLPIAGQGWWMGASLDQGIDCMQLMSDTDPCDPPQYGRIGGDHFVHDVAPVASIQSPSAEFSQCLSEARLVMRGAPYAILGTVPNSRFQALRTDYIVSGTLQARVTTSENGILVYPHRALWFQRADDSNYGCSLRIAADGATRCLPGYALSGRAFADPACTIPIGTVLQASGTWSVLVISDDEHRAHVYEVGDTYQGDTYSLDDSGNCGQFSGSNTFAQPGIEVPPDRFEHYELVAMP